MGLVNVLAGQVLELPPGGKTLYHTALCLTSNYTVTLFATAEQLLLQTGADRVAVDKALMTLLAGALENLRVQGIPRALTGPLTRADWGTIQKHLDALENDRVIRDVYIGLARLTYPVLRARGMPDKFIQDLEELFTQD